MIEVTVKIDKETLEKQLEEENKALKEKIGLYLQEEKFVQESIKKFIPNVTITSLTVSGSTTDGYTADIQIKYDIDEGSFITSDSITTSL